MRVKYLVCEVCCIDKRHNVGPSEGMADDATQRTLYPHIFLVESRPALSAESPEHPGNRGLLPNAPMAFFSCLSHLAGGFFMTHLAAKSKHGHRWYLS